MLLNLEELELTEEQEKRVRGLISRTDFKYKEAMEELTYKNQNAIFLLHELLQDYSFAEKPCPKAALDCSLGSNKNTHGKKSFKWIHEHERVLTLIKIALDYNESLSDMLNKYRGDDR